MIWLFIFYLCTFASQWHKGYSCSLVVSSITIRKIYQTDGRHLEYITVASKTMQFHYILIVIIELSGLCFTILRYPYFEKKKGIKETIYILILPTGLCLSILGKGLKIKWLAHNLYIKIKCQFFPASW